MCRDKIFYRFYARKFYADLCFPTSALISYMFALTKTTSECYILDNLSGGIFACRDLRGEA